MHRRFTTAVLLRAILLQIVLATAGCTCGDREGPVRSAGGTGASARAAWLEACLPSPQRFWDDLRALGGPELDAARLPATLDELASALTGVPADQIGGTVDWSAPVEIVVFEPPGERPLGDAVAVRAHLAARAGASGRREVEGRGGRRLFFEADQGAISFSSSDWALAASRARPGGRCGGGDEAAARVDASEALLGSRQVAAWVARRGASLEASAREATARRGRSTLGDPEVVARMLARWGEGTRARAQAAAPLGLTVTAGPEAIHLALEGRAAADAPARVDPPVEVQPGLLRLVPPDAYLAVATTATGEARREHARAVVDVLARIFGDRMPAAERADLDAAFSRLAGGTRGRMVLALRPALEPGPLVGLAALECADPAETAEDLSEAAALFGRGSLQNLLEHMGARVEVAIASTYPPVVPGSGSIAFQVTAPAGVDEARGQVSRRLLGGGGAPILAWRSRGSLLLVAIGPDPQPELDRLAEASSGADAASVLTQPALGHVAERDPRAELVGYGWLPALAGLLTQGAPGAAGLQPGGLAFSAGDGSGPGRWRTDLRLDRAQVRSLIPWLADRGER